MKRLEFPEPLSATAIPVARAGIPIILALAFATAVFALLGMVSVTLILFAAAVFTLFFFRDPDRAVPVADGAVVSPADGKVVYAAEANDPYFEEKRLKISIFMSVFNVHVNRVPYGGTVSKIDYHPGKFFNASLDKASAHNERLAVFLNTDDGENLCVVQVAGLVARRIICRLTEGDRVKKGARYGMICLGSRLDVYLPANAVSRVSVGDKVSAGTSILGYIHETE